MEKEKELDKKKEKIKVSQGMRSYNQDTLAPSYRENINFILQMGN